MPMANVTYLTAGGQPSFTTATRVGDYEIEQALGANEPTALFIKAKYWQTRADYTRPTPNTTLSYAGGVTGYFVDDLEFRDVGGGVQEFTRLWATIPANWTEPGGTFAFTFPAYTSPIAWGTIYSVTNVVPNGNYYDLTSNASVLAADTFLLDINYVRSALNYHITLQTDAKYAGNGVRVPVAKILPGFGTFLGVTGTLRPVAIGRATPQALEVDSFVLHDYALCDETTADIVLPQVPKFNPIDSTGYITDFLTTGLGTTPNSNTYSSMVIAGSLIPARSSDRRKYAGNIWERTTLVVAAR